MTSGASGRYEVAEVMGRVFPAWRAFAAGVMKLMDFPLPAGPYPKDVLTCRSKTIVEYSTPAEAEGLGNFHSWIGRNDLPISGVAIIIDDAPNVDDGPDLVLLSVRVPSALAGLLPAIIGEVERDTARRK